MLDRRTFTLSGLGLAAGAGLGLMATDTPQAEEAPMTFEITKTAEEWKKLLTLQQYYVLRDHGTERAGTSPLDKIYDPGTYHCAACDLPLFKAQTKFNSGTGWPSFFAPIEGGIGTSVDRKFFMTRTEVHCRRCGGHLGHVFEDGPKPTGLRYCMNGIAMTFKPAEKQPS